MTRLRWLSIILPTAVVGGVELVSDSFLDASFPFPTDTIMVTLLVLLMAVVFSRLAFGRIDRLDAALRARNAELEARNAAARALHEVSVAITGIADLDDILQAVVDNARRLLGGDVAALTVIDPDGASRLRAVSGDSAALAAATDGQRQRIEELLRRGDETIGSLAVGRPADRAVTDDDLATLASLASQAAFAFETDRLQAELRELAVRGERERIARELHDGLAQVLGYVNAKSQAVDELLGVGRTPEARSQLAELAGAARSLYVDVREAILGLRGSVEPESGLPAALRVYGRRFAEASKLAVRVEATPAATGLGLDPAIGDEVFRIVREALTNVRKHAAARRVLIRLDVVDGWLITEVEDDGRGFDPAVVTAGPGDRPRLGLAGIRERAAAVGGRVEWRASADGGTVVRVAIPVGAEVDGDLDMAEVLVGAGGDRLPASAGGDGVPTGPGAPG